ncbi:MAG: UDP-N-acetylmuramoyl-L-alanine--D-glutamate ligase [Propionibacteriaceae bacterium]|nr:UDP-N-acetylmuramoyl-L-alanine--D-glutamate ligase [Propionibacteriaceae bacterium]
MSAADWLPEADRTAPWDQAHVVVAGLGRSGAASADALTELGARVTVVDDADDDAHREQAALFERLGAEVRLGPGASAVLPAAADLVVVSPGWRPTVPLLAQAAQAGLPLWGDVELAWRLQRPDRVVPWLAVTGTNGKTTTTGMLASILAAAGFATAAVGNIGRPVMEAVLDEAAYDVLAVELSSFQLHWLDKASFHSAALLNFAPDHLEWYDDAPAWDCLGWPARAPLAAYAADKARVFEGVTTACVYNAADLETERLTEEADVAEGARAIGFTLGLPAPGQLGLVDGLLVDRAYIAQRRDSALPLARLEDVRPSGPHNVANALAAAALARAYGVAAAAVATGLKAFEPDRHRIETVLEKDGIRWVDDSKATNPHAAEASLSAFDSVVWLAGGQTKKTQFDALAARQADRLRAVVVFGADRAQVAEVMRRHAPDVPVETVEGLDTGAMARAVAAAGRLARPGDTVLLAPGGASFDLFDGYAARGDAFAQAARVWAAQEQEGGADR